MFGISTYLPVDGSDDRRAYIHTGDEAVLKLAVEDESLQDGREEHEEGQRVAPPIGSFFLLCERDQHPLRVTGKRGHVVNHHYAGCFQQ